jgi:hypothetical protein
LCNIYYKTLRRIEEHRNLCPTCGNLYHMLHAYIPSAVLYMVLSLPEILPCLRSRQYTNADCGVVLTTTIGFQPTWSIADLSTLGLLISNLNSTSPTQSIKSRLGKHMPCRKRHMLRLRAVRLMLRQMLGPSCSTVPNLLGGCSC